MSPFKKKLDYLGVDLGGSSVKVVELRSEAGRPQLITYGYLEQPTDMIKNDSRVALDQMVVTLKSVMKKARVSTRRVVAALPSYAVFSSIVSLPTMSKKDLFSAVRWEAKKIVPMSLDEMVLDWKVLKEEAASVRPQAGDSFAASSIDNVAIGLNVNRGPKTLKVLLTAAPRNLVKRYIDIFKLAELEIVTLETEAFALVRSLLGQDQSAVMIVDIGALATEISVILEGIPFLSRSIDVGGDTITKSIANSLNVDADRAEQIKRDFGLTTTPTTSQIPRVIEFVVNNIVNEIRYILTLYQNQGERPIEKIILSGGSAWLPNLPNYLSSVLNLKCYIGDPWSHVAYPVELKPALDEIGPRFSVAIGLALREFI